jgi:hypothetical protein
MSLTAQIRPKSSSIVCRSALCLLLAVLFFYNPFFTIYGTSGFSNVNHPVSYRGTVASSELRRCTVNPVKSLIPAALKVFVASALAQALTVYPVLPTLPHDLSRSIPQVICNSIWFRPPPSL